jgi:hypothetical protein
VKLVYYRVMEQFVASTLLCRRITCTVQQVCGSGEGASSVSFQIAGEIASRMGSRQPSGKSCLVLQLRRVMARTVAPISTWVMVVSDIHDSGTPAAENRGCSKGLKKLKLASQHAAVSAEVYRFDSTAWPAATHRW